MYFWKKRKDRIYIPLVSFSSLAFRMKFVIPYRTEQLNISCLDALLYCSALDKGMDMKQCVFSGIAEPVKRKLASNTSAARVELMLEVPKTKSEQSHHTAHF